MEMEVIERYEREQENNREREKEREHCPYCKIRVLHTNRRPSGRPSGVHLIQLALIRGQDEEDQGRPEVVAEYGI